MDIPAHGDRNIMLWPVAREEMLYHCVQCWSSHALIGNAMRTAMPVIITTAVIAATFLVSAMKNNTPSMNNAEYGVRVGACPDICIAIQTAIRQPVSCRLRFCRSHSGR